MKIVSDIIKIIFSTIIFFVILNFLIYFGQMLHFYLDSKLWKFSEKHNRENTLKYITQ